MKRSNGNGSHRHEQRPNEERESAAEHWRALALGDKSKRKAPLERREEMLKVVKAMRDAGQLTPAEALFSISLQIEQIVDARIMNGDSPALGMISKRLREIESSHGLSPDEAWAFDDAPPEWQALSREYDRVIDTLTAAAFDEHGEPEIATMYRERRAEFDALREEGRRRFFPTTKA